MIKSAAAYHLATNHDRNQMQGHFLDWQNQPTLYKKYSGIEPIPLEAEDDFPEMSLWDLPDEGLPHDPPPVLDLALLSKILFLTCTFTSQSRRGGDIFYYRSNASAGALYPNEIYLTADDIQGLENGLYHYGLKARVLSPLRKGDLSSPVRDAVRYPGPKGLMASFWITGIFFRSAWKYRARAFRYALLDAGHVLQNLISALKRFRFVFDVSYDFDDEKTGHLIGIDRRREACLAAVHLRGNQTAKRKNGAQTERLAQEHIEASRVSTQEVVYPEIEEAYLSGKTDWKTFEPVSTRQNAFGLNPTVWSRLNLDRPMKKEMSYGQTLIQRRSRRNFIRKSISGARFDRLLDLVIKASVQDRPKRLEQVASRSLGFLCQDIAGLKSGIYLLDTNQKEIGLVSAGRYLGEMATVCLGQEWLRNAAVLFVFLTDIEGLDNTLGPRGYRYAMLDAGRIGQAVYLGATALGLGCCGVGAFYDEEARRLLDLSKNAFMLYLVAAGRVKEF